MSAPSDYCECTFRLIKKYTVFVGIIAQMRCRIIFLQETIINAAC
jgi:hypothetical protein